MHSYLVSDIKKKIRIIGSAPILDYPYGFFDGAATVNMGGAAIFIAINNVHSFSIKLGCGISTNTSVEILALWALLYFV